MSKKATEQALLKIADDLLALAAAVLEDDSVSTNTKIGKNTLKDSFLKRDLFATVSWTGGDDAVIKALFNNYVVYLEWDRPRKYGKQPPISELKEWAQRAGIPTDADTLWAISYAIWRDGHVGRPIFATMDKEVEGLFYNDWSDKLFTAITDNLDLIFNN